MGVIRTIYRCSLLVVMTGCSVGGGDEGVFTGGTDKSAAAGWGGAAGMAPGTGGAAGGSTSPDTGAVVDGGETGASAMAGSGASATGTGIPGTGGAGGSWPGSDAGVIKEDIVSAYGTNPDQSEQEAAVRQAFDQALDTCLPPGGADLCARDTCGLVRSCCVGRGDCCQATELSGIPKEPLDLSPCDGQEPAACLAREGWPVEAFGPRQSHVHGDGFYPGGDATGDSGLRLQPLFDLQSQRVKLSAVFHRGIADCNAGCLEGVGIGFSAAQELPADATGNIALVYSKSIGEMRLVRNGMVVAQADMTGTEQKWTLELQPSGRALAYADDGAEDPAIDSLFEPVSGSRLALFGRSDNPSSAHGVHLSAPQAEVALCDMPGGWSERGALVLKRANGNQWQPNEASAPSAARDDEGNTMLAFESSGDIYLAVQDAIDPYTFVLYGKGITPIVDKSALAGAVALGDPSLVWDGSIWIVFFAVDRGEGQSEIASASAPSWGEFIVEDRLDIRGYQGPLYAPSVAQRDPEKMFMVANGQKEQARHDIFFFESVDGGFIWNKLPHYSAGPAAVLDRACEADTGAFFCDGIGTPSLSIHNLAWHLHFAGKQGTRWAIGLLVSDVLTGWAWKLLPESGPVLKASGSGFDRLSVLHAGALNHIDAVELFYAGSDGAGTALGRAFRAATSDGRF